MHACDKIWLGESSSSRIKLYMLLSKQMSVDMLVKATVNLEFLIEIKIQRWE